MPENKGKAFQKTYIDVLGLCCTSEVPVIERILQSTDGVKDFSVVIPTKTVIVIHDPLVVSPIDIAKALNQARLEANIRPQGARSHKNRLPSPYAVACGALLLLSFLKYAYAPFKWLTIGAIAVGIIPVLFKAVSAIRNLTIEINILILIAVGGSIALEDYWEAATIVFLFTIAEWLESSASHKATAAMSSLLDVVPQRAVIAETGEEINADEVKLNTVLAVKAGEAIPIDGVVVDGTCEVDEKFLTGESFPVAKLRDSPVFASTINLNGYITIRTTAVAEDCVVARMAKLVEESQNKKSKVQRLMDKCAKYYTPTIVLISAAVALVPVIFHLHNKGKLFHLSLVVLVSACPCPLLLSTPVAMFCALSEAARLGILFKGAEHVETLAKIKIIGFDKTGTITKGEFHVAHFSCLLDNIRANELLQWISSIESKSSHPMAAALVDYGREHDVQPLPESIDDFETYPGEGISGQIYGKKLFVGNRKIASRAGFTGGSLEGYGREGMSTGYVFIGSSLAGVFNLTDSCRTGAKGALKELKSNKIKTVMLTGDSKAAADFIQSQLGGILDIVHAELLPTDKEHIVKLLQKEGRTAMIGDGVNDAPALAAADVGISMGVSGSALATETGDVILMTNDIGRVPKAIKLAKKTRRKIIENVIVSLLTKAGVLGLAIAGHPLVWAAVLADVGTCLLVIFNSMLLLKGNFHCNCFLHGQKCRSSSHCSRDGKICCSENQPMHRGCCPPESHIPTKNCSNGGGYCGDFESQKKCCDLKSASDYSHGGKMCCSADRPEKCNDGGGCCADLESQKKCCNPKPSSGHSHSGKVCCSDDHRENTAFHLPESHITATGCSNEGGCCAELKTQKKCCNPKSSSDHSHGGKVCCSEDQPENRAFKKCSGGDCCADLESQKKCCKPKSSSDHKAGGDNGGEDPKCHGHHHEGHSHEKKTYNLEPQGKCCSTKSSSHHEHHHHESEHNSNCHAVVDGKCSDHDHGHQISDQPVSSECCSSNDHEDPGAQNEIHTSDCIHY